MASTFKPEDSCRAKKLKKDLGDQEAKKVGQSILMCSNRWSKEIRKDVVE